MEIRTEISYIAATGKKVTQTIIQVIKTPETAIIGIGSVVVIS